MFSYLSVVDLQPDGRNGGILNHWPFDHGMTYRRASNSATRHG